MERISGVPSISSDNDFFLAIRAANGDIIQLTKLQAQTILGVQDINSITARLNVINPSGNSLSGGVLTIGSIRPIDNNPDFVVQVASVAAQYNESKKGLHYRKMAHVIYDFSTDGGGIGIKGTAVQLPPNPTFGTRQSIVMRTIVVVIQSPDSDQGTGTIKLQQGNTQLMSFSTDSGTPPGIYDGDQDGTIGNAARITDSEPMEFVIETEDLTGGKFEVFIEYFVSE